MSRGQYELKRRQVKEGGTQGEVGLDLDVMDHYNGSVRRRRNAFRRRRFSGRALSGAGHVGYDSGQRRFRRSAGYHVCGRGIWFAERQFSGIGDGRIDGYGGERPSPDRHHFSCGGCEKGGLPRRIEVTKQPGRWKRCGDSINCCTGFCAARLAALKQAVVALHIKQAALALTHVQGFTFLTSIHRAFFGVSRRMLSIYRGRKPVCCRQRAAICASIGQASIRPAKYAALISAKKSASCSGASSF